MKYTTTYIFALMLAGSVSAQEANVMWLDNALKPTKKRQSTFRQEVLPMGDKFNVKTFDASNILIMEALSDVPDGQKITGDVSYFHANGNLESKGAYHYGKKLGVWKRYDTSGIEKSERVYNLFNPELMAYHFTDEMPVFPGGNENFEHFMQQNFSSYVQENASNGELMKYAIVINTNGHIDNIKILQSVSKELDAELKSTLSKMPNWKPGEKYGEKVRVVIEREIYCKQ